MPEPTQYPFDPPRNLPGAPERYAAFWRLWRQERFFECHEVLEEMWRETPGAERWFLNGLIHCAVAIYQHRRGNAVGAARQLVRAEVKLKPFAPRFGGIETEPLLRHVRGEVAASLESLTDKQRAGLTALQESLDEKIRRHFPSGKFVGKWEEWNGR